MKSHTPHYLILMILLAFADLLQFVGGDDFESHLKSHDVVQSMCLF